MNITMIVVLCVVLWVATLALGFVLGRRTAPARGGRPGGKLQGPDRDIVL